MLVDGEIARHVADIFRKQGGSDAWYKLSIEELLPARYRSEASHLAKGLEIFDVWFDNSLTWDFSLLKDAHSFNEVSTNLNQELQQLGLAVKQDVEQIEEKSGGGGRRGIRKPKKKTIEKAPELSQE